MSVAAKCLINSKYAANSVATEYTAPASTRVIVDKFTATNIDSSSRTLSVYLVPSGDSASDANLVLDSVSIAANTCRDCTELKNQILNAGDTIQVLASASSNINIRASGREVTS